MSRALLTSFTAVALVICLAADANAAVEETLERTLSIATDGRLSVENVNGEIEISAWERPEVHVVAVKKAKHRADLEKIEVEMTSSHGDVRIRTHHGAKRGWLGLFGNWFNRGEGEVKFEIQVPPTVELDEIRTVNGSVHIRSAGGRIRAEAVNGSLTLEDVSGPLRLSTVNGSVKVQLAELSRADGVSLSTVNGSVRLTLPADSDASFSVRSVNGSINTDFDAGRGGRFITGRSLKAAIGTGEAPVNITTVNGRVSIRTDGSIQSASR